MKARAATAMPNCQFRRRNRRPRQVSASRKPGKINRIGPNMIKKRLNAVGLTKFGSNPPACDRNPIKNGK